MQVSMANQQHKAEAYRVTTEEVKDSLEWLEEQYKEENAFVGGQRSEVKEIRFKVQDASSAMKDEDILRKFREAQSLSIESSNEKPSH